MLYEFRSKAGGTVVMTQPVAERLLEIIGKPPARAGVFEPDQLLAAITAIEASLILGRLQMSRTSSSLAAASCASPSSPTLASSCR